MRFESFLEESAARFGSKAALIAGEQRVHYHELEAISRKLANSLADRGVCRHDRVLIVMDNCAEAAISIFAVLKAGGVFSVINPTTKAAKLAYIINDCEPAAILTL